MFPSHLLGARRMDNLHSATGSLSDQISTMTLHSDESDDSDESGEMETLPGIIWFNRCIPDDL